MLSVLPALTSAIARWAYFFGLGMHQTAFYYFRATTNDYFFLRVFLVVLFATSFVSFMSTVLLKDRAQRKTYTYYAVIVMLFGLLLVTGYRLNRSPWYPDFSSLLGLCYNATVALLFILLGIMVFRESRWAKSYSGFLVAGLLVLTTNGYFRYRQSATPVIFTDVADEVGLREMNDSLGVAWGDYDDDGWLDLYVSNHLPASTKSLLYQNKNGFFSAPRPMATGDLHGAAWGDFDNDGDLDLFVAGGNDTPIGPAYPNHLFRNEGGSFEDVASSTGVEDTLGRAWGGTWADFNNDGFLDLFVVNYFSSNDLFLNAGNGTFKNVSKDAGITETNPGEGNKVGTLCASWADYDGDNDMDLLTAGIESGVALYRNNANGTFSEVARDSGLIIDGQLGTEDDPRGPSGCAWGDYDNDGDLDAYISTTAGKLGKNLLFQNQGNRTFVEVGAVAGVDIAARSRAVMWGDFDNDGDLDLYVVNEASEEDADGWNSLLLNQGDGTFAELDADAAGVAGFPFIREGTGALVDYDDDGFIDIYINDQRTPEERYFLKRNILLRNSGNTNNWLEIKLRGTVSNRDGVGAKILLSAGNQKQFRERGGESHTFAQNSSVVHFGLGRVAVVDRVLVEWPSGITQTLTNISANRTLTITEPVTP